MKLFIVLEKALDAGLKMAQTAHAVVQFGYEYPEIKHHWYTESNNIVVLHEDDLPSLADELEKMGYSLSRFTEPDLDDQLTAICVEPAAKKALCKLELAAA